MPGGHHFSSLLVVGFHLGAPSSVPCLYIGTDTSSSSKKSTSLKFPDFFISGEPISVFIPVSDKSSGDKVIVCCFQYLANISCMDCALGQLGLPFPFLFSKLDF